jgi:hypothetical protein
LTRASIKKIKSHFDTMDCRVRPGNDAVEVSEPTGIIPWRIEVARWQSFS